MIDRDNTIIPISLMTHKHTDKFYSNFETIRDHNLSSFVLDMTRAFHPHKGLMTSPHPAPLIMES